MPELPEVENVRTGLLPLVGRTLRPHEFSKYPRFNKVSGASGEVRYVQRRGKWLIVGLRPVSGPPVELIVHLGMTGRLSLSAELRPDPHMHASWRIERHDHLGAAWLTYVDPRRFGRLELVSPGEYGSISGLDRLGPDATDPAAIEERLRSLERSSRSVKAALLDQSVLAGAGNIYCDEALFDARLHPATSCRSLDDGLRRSLASSLATSIQSSIRNGGTTFRDYRQVDGSPGTNVHALKCYGRAGLPCLRCGTLMALTKVAGRSTCYCPTCQTAPS